MEADRLHLTPVRVADKRTFSHRGLDTRVDHDEAQRDHLVGVRDSLAGCPRAEDTSHPEADLTSKVVVSFGICIYAFGILLPLVRQDFPVLQYLQASLDGGALPEQVGSRVVSFADHTVWWTCI